MIGYKRILRTLRNIKNRGYIRTHRKGKNGIGKTLEDLLGIRENNIPGPNAEMIELKSAREKSNSLLTLFTKAPLPKAINKNILKKYGYKSPTNPKRKILHTTVNAKRYNTIKNRKCFKLVIKEDRIALLVHKRGTIAYWNENVLKNTFERKLPKLIYVKASTKGKGRNEAFYFHKTWLLYGFGFGKFKRLLKEAVILVDIRIGQYRDGRTHDHGTAFRILPKNLNKCFKYRQRIM